MDLRSSKNLPQQLTILDARDSRGNAALVLRGLLDIVELFLTGNSLVKGRPFLGHEDNNLLERRLKLARDRPGLSNRESTPRRTEEARSGPRSIVNDAREPLAERDLGLHPCDVTPEVLLPDENRAPEVGRESDLAHATGVIPLLVDCPARHRLVNEREEEVGPEFGRRGCEPCGRRPVVAAWACGCYGLVVEPREGRLLGEGGRRRGVPSEIVTATATTTAGR